jgi:hypothetical protein
MHVTVSVAINIEKFAVYFALRYKYRCLSHDTHFGLHVMYLILFFKLNKVQICIKAIINKLHGIRQTGSLWYMRTEGNDEAKRRILQLSGRA